METSEKVSIFARLNVKGGIPSPLHNPPMRVDNPPMRVDTLSWGFVYSKRQPAFAGCLVLSRGAAGDQKMGTTAPP